jgi:hypothetical protein
MAYEEDIQRLNISIQQREQLLKQDILSDEGIKQLGNDVQARYFSNIFLQNLKDGEYIRIITYRLSFNAF